uniref:40S ribosomal protein S8 n=1 Tax=Sexangularia sp. CB-2014 TaxID=1486929 RepID=A0A7S1VNM8_9EUKA|eukprot:CAMPEP_0170740494 /NCGR_PEP_ID=MMETSP0437-20130122/5713_1 /TAXON_ID=0 /ORGANISM="Sexangularia sp." /LENGTH=194 /DNA_ID=CAMNT_0011078997 /DNA_START=64 /DNA_END=648 /DNA_ORIENTATION=-
MGISRDSWHKKRTTGGRMNPIRRKRKFELGRPPANTKIGARRVHTVRTMGGNTKLRALRLDHGNFAWGRENSARTCRILSSVYNATSNELVRTNTLTKGCIVQIDATPFKSYYFAKYGIELGKKKDAKYTPSNGALKRAKHVSALDSSLTDQFNSGRLLARVGSRPGQDGKCDGYILEGAELAFYQRKLQKKGK